MAKTKISEYDSTAANNTDIDGINIAESCAPSGINNAIREQMAHLKDGLGAGTPVFLDQTNNRVGIGTTSPDRSLHIAGNPAQIIIEDTGGGTDDKRAALFTDSGVFEIASKNDDDSTRVNDIFCADLGTGNIGIGTNAPSDTLDIERATGVVSLGLQSRDSSDTKINFGDNSDGDVGIINYAHNVNAMIFTVNASERMRIDSSGNLLVNTTSSSAHTNSAGSSADNAINLRADGLLNASRFSGNAAFFNRTSTDGSIVVFNKDGTNVGGIGVNSGDQFFFASADGAGIKVDADNSGGCVPCNTAGANLDNSIDLGISSSRWDDVRATNGTIQTSDENEKQNIESLTSVEITAATAISKLFKTFKWKDKVAAKGNDARTHTGVIAQQVQTAMSDAGLDVSKYAFWCLDIWWETSTEVEAVEADEENGIEAQEAYTRIDSYSKKDKAPEGATERTRLGIRYPELLAFIGAATEQRLTSIEARLDALEG